MRTTKIFKHKPECIDLTLNEPREKPKVVDDDIVFIEEVKSDLVSILSYINWYFKL